ncbi:MAG: sigma-70 family RNA polymerase sigma factor [Bacteroidia bacterium]|jgi:RNA polymerase sigma-70 factor (ECF subfamily)|nr:sigma-70 family RNA polymerase sigma factor [Bacteroidia bacterium]
MGSAGYMQAHTAALFKTERGKLTAVLLRRLGMQHLELVEDAVQDAFAEALQHWPQSGMPQNAAAWLMRVAANKALNALKRYARQSGLDEQQLAALQQSTDESATLPGQLADSELRLLFACVQLEFPVRNRILLTLHLMCGLDTRELAAALFMQPEAVKKALQRMKAELRSRPGMLETGWPLLSAGSVADVQLVLYLMFNEGCKTTRSSVLINHELCFGAMRLTQLLCTHVNKQRDESYGLLALMFFALARFEARVDEHGDIVPLARQNRSLWNRQYLAEGFACLHNARHGKRFYLEALIASVHCAAATFERTNWTQLVFLYTQLLAINPSPIVELNLLLARSYAETPAAVLPELQALRTNAALQNTALLLASEADVLERAGRRTEAFQAYQAAAAATESVPERRLYLKRAAQCA